MSINPVHTYMMPGGKSDPERQQVPALKHPPPPPPLLVTTVAPVASAQTATTIFASTSSPASLPFACCRCCCFRSADCYVVTHRHASSVLPASYTVEEESTGLNASFTVVWYTQYIYSYRSRKCSYFQQKKADEWTIYRNVQENEAKNIREPCVASPFLLPE